MGKIVKFCGSCNEGFAEKFGFCPTCGAPLEAFELNPVNAEESETPVAEKPEENVELSAPESSTPLSAESNGNGVLGNDTETTDLEAEPIHAVVTGPLDASFVEEADMDDAAARAVAGADVAALNEAAERERRIAEAVTEEVPVYFKSKEYHADEIRPSVKNVVGRPAKGDYNPTVIEEKNTGQRNGLLLASFALMLILALGGTVYSLFNKSLGIGSIEEGQLFNAVMVEDVPMTVVEEEVKKAKEEGGGGGGGGREEQTETSQGDLANQTKNPIRPPDVRVHRMDNPSLELPPPSTEGDRKFEQKYGRWGDPNSKNLGLSNGTGSGGGQGSGVGTGQGSGYGTGTGSGTGSGSGSGTGSGNGDGSGVGGSPPPRKPAVTKAFRILSKPRATYTDAAREKQVQGKVVLRVTFLASGSIGSITTVKGLPYGLTEQAIAAARRIRFEPKTVNGVGTTQTRPVEYSFTIY